MKLASIEIIEELNEINGADNIVMATIMGWSIIVKKDEFKVSDKCMYIPIDSIIDVNREHFSGFKNKETDKFIRINTRKIRGVYSQGIALPLQEFINIEGFNELEIDNDFGELIGVTKYKKDESELLNDSFIPKFPIHIISKTDEDNLKSKKKSLKEFFNKEIYISQKQDGSSMTLIWINETIEGTVNNVFYLSKRNTTVLKIINGIEEFVFKDPVVDYVKKHEIYNKFIGKNIALQGEFCGPKINGNKLKLDSYHWYIFNMYSLEDNNRILMSLPELQIFTDENDFELVPILNKFICDENNTIEFFQNVANNVKYGEVKGEGIVVRPVVPIYSNYLDKYLSVKIINQDYKD